MRQAYFLEVYHYIITSANVLILLCLSLVKFNSHKKKKRACLLIYGQLYMQFKCGSYKVRALGHQQTSHTRPPFKAAEPPPSRPPLP